jgi:hypothetical protein
LFDQFDATIWYIPKDDKTDTEIRCSEIPLLDKLHRINLVLKGEIIPNKKAQSIARLGFDTYC